LNAVAFALEDVEPASETLPERALWCAALALLLDDARRYHRTGKDPIGAVPGTGRRAFRDVLERGPMVSHLCVMTDQEPEWLCWRFEKSLDIRQRS